MKRVLAIVAISLLCATFAAAQDYLGSISGKITDEEGHVIPAAKVVISSPAIMGVRELTSTDNGLYRAINLPPGIYTVRVSKENYTTYEHKDLTMRADFNITLNVKLKVGAFEQTITVMGEAPIIDPTETGQKFNISGDFHRSLPISVRNEAFEILQLVPGATNPEGLSKYAYFNIHGTDEFDEPPAWDIDGANAASQEYGMNTTRINLDIIEDTSIDLTKTSAAYASGQSGAVRIVTKSGGNELSGTLNFQYQPKQWNDTNVEDGTPKDTKFYQFSTTLGGPIIKDRAWFFGSYRYQLISDGVSRTQEVVDRIREATGNFEPFRNDQNRPDVFGKISLGINDDHNVFLSYQQEWGGDDLVSGNVLESGIIHENSSGYYVNGNWNWAVTNDLILTTSASYTNKPRRRYYDDNTVTGRTYYTYATVGSGNISGTGAIYQEGVWESRYDQEDEAVRIKSDASWFLSTNKGSHDIQFGVFLEPKLRNQILSSNEASPRKEYLVANDPNDLSKGFTPFYREYYPLGDNAGVDTKVQRYAGYINDSWQLTDRLVLQAGLRLAIAKSEDELDGEVFSTPWTKGLSPNIGFSYALTDDKETIVRGSYSRHYNNITAGALPTSDRYGSYDRTREYDNDLDGTFETVIFIPATYVSVDNVEWGDVDLLGYSDDISLGVSRELPWDTTISLDYIYRETGGGLTWLWNAVIEDGVWQGPIVPGAAYNEFMTPVENTYNWRTYNGLDITLNKAMSDNLQFLITYSYGKGRAEGVYSPDNPLHYISPNSYPMQTTNLNHSARINVVYLAPYDVVVAVTGSLNQGALSDSILLILGYADDDLYAHGPDSIYDEATGTYLENPLFDSWRDYGDSRDDDRWRGEATYTWNLRVGKNFNIMDRYRLEAAVDVYNILNSGSHPTDFYGTIQPYYPDRIGELSTGTYQSPRAAKASIKLIF